MSRFTFILFLVACSFFLSAQPSPPGGVVAKGYDSHVELSWNPSSDPTISGFRIYRKFLPDGASTNIGYVGKYVTSYIDFIGREDAQLEYSLTAINALGEESVHSNLATATTYEMTDDELLTMVQEYTFRYFWDFAHPVSGMARERNTTSIVTTGGSGFGVMAILVGIERGFITREEGLQRLLKISNFLETADRFHGAWPHWMNGGTGVTIPFSQYDDGGDLVETSFMIQGLLTARAYFDGNNENEVALRNKITQLWETVDWRWYRKQTQEVLYWHWSPNYAWQINFALRGFNETHIVYLLATASPTLFVPPSLYHNGWAGGNYTNNGTFYGYPLEVGPNFGGPLFFSHYSYLGFDPRGIRDAYTNYFIRNYYHTLVNRAYCIDNPENHAGYSDVCWGLTASDDPFGYLAHTAIPNRDNGTITPTAALSSMPYTPQLSIQALKHFYREHGARLWGEYGFYDAFNLDEDWYASSYLAIDQGPIICMIENYRTGLLWDNFMSNPEITTALDALGFEPDTTDVGIEVIEAADIGLKLSPNPVSEVATLSIELKQNERINIIIYNTVGMQVENVCTDRAVSSGMSKFDFSVQNLPSGNYFVEIQSKDWRTAIPFVVQ